MEREGFHFCVTINYPAVYEGEKKSDINFEMPCLRERQKGMECRNVARMKSNYHRFGIAALSAFLTFALPGQVFADPPQKDREAILAMAGEYKVLFNFSETVAYVKDYKLKDSYQEEASEIVLVIEDTPGKITLQHILLAGKDVIKHWKQVWTWEDLRIVEYQGNNEWNVRELSKEEAVGTWSQLVTQVDDSPRYESFGKWEHRNGISRWESQTTARPLPRREYTTRKDYDILEGINRHVITPYGWAHEQDNYKLALERDGKPAHYIVGEHGLNEYDKTTDIDFSAAEDYWKATSAYWKEVAAQWESIMNTRSTFSIRPRVDDKPLWKPMFALAKPLADGKSTDVPGVDAIREVLEKYVK